VFLVISSSCFITFVSTPYLFPFLPLSSSSSSSSDARYRRALGGVISAYGGAAPDDALPVGPGDTAALVLGLNRTAGDDGGSGCSPSAAHLLLRTLFVTEKHPLWRVDPSTLGDGAMDAEV